MIKTGTITIAALTMAFLLATGVALTQTANNSNSDLLSPVSNELVTLSN